MQKKKSNQNFLTKKEINKIKVTISRTILIIFTVLTIITLIAIALS